MSRTKTSWNGTWTSDSWDSTRSMRSGLPVTALGGDVYLGVGTADHLRQKEDAVHINLGSDLDAGRILDVARQQRLGADPCQGVRAPQDQRHNDD